MPKPDPGAGPGALMIRALESGRLVPGRALVVGDESGAVAPVVRAAGGAAVVWNRRGPGARPWPPEEAFDSALVRLPKSRDEVAMTLHAAAGRLAPGGSLWLWGRNDEGIRPALTQMEALFGAAETDDVRAHARLLRAERTADLPGLKPELADWREVREVEIAGRRRTWVSYPGLFAHGRFDPATLLLLDHLPDLPAGSRALDYGCGSGVLGAALLGRQPDAQVDLLDTDAVALEAARENVPQGRIVQGERLGAVGAVRYDLIVSNPPLHAGFADNFAALRALLADLPAHLAPRGSLLAVTQRRLDLQKFAGDRVEGAVVAESSEFRVWRVVPKGPGGRTGGRAP